MTREEIHDKLERLLEPIKEIDVFDYYEDLDTFGYEIELPVEDNFFWAYTCSLKYQADYDLKDYLDALSWGLKNVEDYEEQLPGDTFIGDTTADVTAMDVDNLIYLRKIGEKVAKLIKQKNSRVVTILVVTLLFCVN